MSHAPASATSLRDRLRRPGDTLAAAPIGTVPILWNNVDIAELRAGTDADTILDEIARTGYEGVQLGLGFPEGHALRRALEDRGLRLAEVYASLPCTIDGPTDDALGIARSRLDLLAGGGGDVLVVACDVSPGRIETAGRAAEPSTPRLTEEGWRRLATVLTTLADETAAVGARIAYHPHAGTFVETPEETDRLLSLTEASGLGLCLDTGHWIVGGGDPADALRAHAARLEHVHLKDVDPTVLAGLRAGETGGFLEAIRLRLFTELGAGALDLPAVIDALAGLDYRGWLMTEQDSCWGPPSESAAISRRVLAAELRRRREPGA
jgi:inosose dehydratase